MIRRFSNSIWATIEYLWNPLLIFVCTPYFLRSLGAEDYGFWMLALTAAAAGTVLNAGTGAATIKFVSNDSGQSDPGRLERSLRGSITLAVAGGTLLAASIAAIFFWGDAVLFPKVANHSLLHITGLAAAALAWIEQLDNVFASALKGFVRYDLAARAELAAKTVQALALLLAIYSGGGLLAVYWVLVLTGGLRLLVKAELVRRVLQIQTFKPEWRYVRAVLDFSKWGWLQGLAGLFFGVADRFFVGSILGVVSLAHYSVVLQLTSQIHGLVAAAVSVVFPMISRKRAAASATGASVAGMIRPILAANVLLSTLLAVALLAFGKWILGIWLGAEASRDLFQLLAYLTLAYWLLALNITPYYVLLGLGQVRVVTILCILSGAIGLAAMVYGTHRWGMTGVGLGRLVYALLSLSLFLPLQQAIPKEKST